MALYTVKEAAEILNISEKWIYGLIENGTIEAKKIYSEREGRFILHIEGSEIDWYLEKRDEREREREEKMYIFADIYIVEPYYPTESDDRYLEKLKQRAMRALMEDLY